MSPLLPSQGSPSVRPGLCNEPAQIPTALPSRRRLFLAACSGGRYAGGGGKEKSAVSQLSTPADRTWEAKRGGRLPSQDDAPGRQMRRNAHMMPDSAHNGLAIWRRPKSDVMPEAPLSAASV